MLQKDIKKALKEAKDKQNQLLIEQNLVKSRIMMIVESEDNLKNFNSLPIQKQEKIAFGVLSEIGYLQEHEMLKDRKSTRLNSSHIPLSRMPSSA